MLPNILTLHTQFYCILIILQHASFQHNCRRNARISFKMEYISLGIPTTCFKSSAGNLQATMTFSFDD